MTSYNYKVSDSRPAVDRRLTRGGERVDLSNANRVELYVDDGDGTVIVNRESGTIADREQAIVQYEWGDELNAATGDYRVEWIVVFDDGAEQTVPERGFDRITLSRKHDRDQTVLTLAANESLSIGANSEERYSIADVDTDATISVDHDGTLDLTGAQP